MATDSGSDDSQSNLWKESPKLIIIGAGISGIACGDYLARAGFTNFQILEATNRVGGRIWTVDVGGPNGPKAELGANWIHGIEKNPIFKVAMQNKLLDVHYQGRQLGQKVKFAMQDGSPVNTKIVEEVDWTYGLLMQQCEEFHQLNMPTPVENDSVGAFLQREFEQKLMRYKGEDRHIRQMIFDQRLLWEGVIHGCHTLEDVALSEMGSFEELPGVHHTIPPGFEAIIKILKRSIPDENVLLNHAVSQISWNEADKNDNNYEVCVECQNGKKYYANLVLVTTSLGYLKKNAGRLFNPPLPDFKLDAMNRLSFGTVNKIILEFDKRILPPGVFKLEMLWDRSNIEHEDMQDAWIKKLHGFECLSERVLIAWLSGKEAIYIEGLTEAEISEKVCKALKNFLRTELPPLKSCSITRWNSNPYTCGSYSYIPVGATVEDIESMGEPISAPGCQDKPQLLFAGEATHATYYSSSHGALLSGQREAQRILDMYSH